MSTVSLLRVSVSVSDFPSRRTPVRTAISGPRSPAQTPSPGQLRSQARRRGHPPSEWSPGEQGTEQPRAWAVLEPPDLDPVKKDDLFLQPQQVHPRLASSRAPVPLGSHSLRIGHIDTRSVPPGSSWKEPVAQHGLGGIRGPEPRSSNVPFSHARASPRI